MNQADSRTFRLAAVDLDGTLLSPDLRISEPNREAIRRLQAGGCSVVLASGRHYKSMLPFARQIPGIEWILSAQGGEVSDLERKQIISQRFLDRNVAEQAFRLGHEHGFSVILYGIDDIFVSDEDKGDRFYAHLSGRTPLRVPAAELFTREIFKIIWIGDESGFEEARSLKALDDLAATKIRTHQKIFEIVPNGVSKGVGMAALAKHLNLSAADAVGFGDAENDIPLFEWAGTSIAMPDGWPSAQKHASAIGPAGPAETAFARAVDLALSGQIKPRALSVATESTLGS